ncbi:MAG: hypothetical protein ACXWCG_13175 [Flavitalea sp.]
MKVSTFACALGVASILLFSTCKKSQVEDPQQQQQQQPAAPVCRIETIQVDTNTATLSYDSRGRMAQVSFDDGKVEIYTYTGDTVTITRSKNDFFDSRVIAVYNPQGLATQVRLESNSAGTAGTKLRFLYSDTTMVRSFLSSFNNSNATTSDYGWTDGNLVQISAGGGSTVTLLEYFTDKPSQPGDYFHYVNLSQGYTIFKTKSLLKRISAGGDVLNFDYAFDSVGKIKELRMSGAVNSLIRFTYTCN